MNSVSSPSKTKAKNRGSSFGDAVAMGFTFLEREAPPSL